MTEPLVRVRRHLAGAGIEALLVPIADRFQSSPIAAHDQRVAWLTGYQGTAGLLAISCTRTAFLVGRRDRAEATEQLDPAQVRILPGTHVSLRDWLTEESGSNPVRSVGYDPELHTHAAISALKSTLAESGLDLRPVPGFIDGLWAEQPPRPIGRLIEQSECHAGESGMAKRQRVLAHLRNAGRDCLLVANPESLAWLLNLRSDAVPYNPIPHAIGLLDTTGDVSLFTDCPEHPYTDPGHHGVRVIGISELESTLRSLVGNVQYDGSRTNARIVGWLGDSDAELVSGPDPCLAMMAQKNPTELQGFRDSHHRDGLAMVKFLHWFGAQSPGDMDEHDVARTVDGFREALPESLGASFPTIAAAGPNGAIVHYHAIEGGSRALLEGEGLIVDSGGQYCDGTTDVTRTLAIGSPPQSLSRCYTTVLKALIMLSTARWPADEPASSLDVLARYHLWNIGHDYPHGTGHGVGHWLNVHAGVSNIGRGVQEPLAAGMVVTIEPGWYKKGAGGVRLENMAIVTEAAGHHGSMLAFETITEVPFDRNLIAVDRLNPQERDWLDNYHAAVRERFSPHLSGDAAAWLDSATAPIGD